MKRLSALFVVFAILCRAVFAQTGASALRDYVGLINQSYHPDIVAYFEKMKADFEKDGKSAAARAVDLFLEGATGSGFVITDEAGTNYIVTNYHVIAQAARLSITFERQDGFKKSYDNLVIIAADEDRDLALLTLAPGDKITDQGLALLERPVEESEDVYSAGFPGLGITSLWQFGRGMVSNASVRFPKSLDDETLMGPFIQHTAQVDPGNSGGPLLVVQQDIPTGYAVAGVNTLSATRRQAANYTIPADTVRDFINAALHPQKEAWRGELDKRLSAFTGGLGANRAVYPHIASFLSAACVGENAEYATLELLEKAPLSVRQRFFDKCEDDVVEAMGYAVGWIIENSMRSQGTIRAAVKDVSGEDTEYTVVFTIGGNDIDSRWVREYGAWRLRTFGGIAAGDKDLIVKREAERKTREALRTDSDITVEAGYAYLFDKAPAALYASVDYRGLGLQVYFAGSDFIAAGLFYGWRGGFSLGKVGLMPFIRAGIEYHKDKGFEDYSERDTDNLSGFSVSAMLRGDLRITTSMVPGLFIGAGFQYNIFSLMDKDYKDTMKMAVSVTAGYGF